VEGKHEPNPLVSKEVLRSRAHEQIRKLAIIHHNVDKMSAEGISDLIHHLEIHQIELELQNEELRVSQAELLKARNRYSDLYDFAPVGYLTIQTKGLIIEANLAFAEMMKLGRRQLIGKHLGALIHATSQNTYLLFLSKAQTLKGRQSCELCLNVSSDATYWVRMDSKVRPEAGSRLNTIDLSFTNITQQRIDQEQLKRQAYYDILTDLPNRKLLVNRFEQYLAHLQRNPNYGALLYIDLDNFKLVNDSLGHSVGDRLLLHVAEVLRMSVSTEDTAARFGGDEFVVLLTDLNADKNIAAIETQRIADKISQSLIEPWGTDEFCLRIEVSIGIVIFPNGRNSCYDIINHADIAMYRAKNSGKNSVVFYNEDIKTLLQLQQDLRQALEQKEFKLHFQPQINHHNKVLGAECLLRWQHPSRGCIMPSEFLPLLEKSGSVMTEVGTWILKTACQQLADWQQTKGDLEQLSLSVHVSPKHFNHRLFSEELKTVLSETGANPKRLVIEITENILLKNIETTIRKMKTLNKLGISFAIDDFGTGYSSLSNLKLLPFDTLKIGQSFVYHIDSNKDNATLVDIMMDIAKYLKLNIIAEGVETPAEKRVLIDKGCTCFQGEYFSNALSRVEFEEYAGATSDALLPK